MTGKVVPLRRRGFRCVPINERGTPPTHEHLAYTDQRIPRSYAKYMGLRSIDVGLQFTYWDVDGQPLPDFARWRVLPQRGEQKFGQPPGSRNHLYLAPLVGRASWRGVCDDPEIPIFVTEKELSAAALAQHGYKAIGLNGVFGWLYDGLPILDFDLVDWKKRKVVVVFDADVAANANVQAALIRLLAELRRRGAEPSFVLLPDLGDGKSGVDDLVMAKGIRAFRALPEHTLDEPQFESWGLAKEPGCTDVGNAVRFVLQHAQELRYAHEWRTWLLWGGVRWHRDATEAVYGNALATMRAIYRAAQEHPDPDRRKELAAWAAKSEDAWRIDKMLRIARTDRAIATSASLLDTHPMLLAVANGVVDLKAGTLLPGDPRLLLTKQSPISFDPKARCPRFLKFLREVMPDAATVAYLRRVIGYFLTGDTREQCFFVFYGIGSNGKSTLLRILTALLGDFATSTRMETWTAQRRSAGGPSEDVARLHGARLVSSVESEDGQQLAESLVKELTGEDRVNARRLFENSFEFVPQFKLILVCNHKPVIRGDDPAIWRRVRLVPFEQVFSDKQKDKGLIGKLRAELPGILNWAIAGCLEWQEKGLAEPKKILEATAEYRSDSDVMTSFLADCCDTGKGREIVEAAGDLYREYRNWAINNGHRPMSSQRFGRRLQDKGFRRIRVRRGTEYVGLQLKDRHGIRGVGDGRERKR